MHRNICVISQPRFFPGLHYLHRMMVANVFVIFDTVQYTPRHEENRAKIKTQQGPQWLTVPMFQSSRGQLIRDTRIDNSQDWQRRIIRTIESVYGRASHYQSSAQEIINILEQTHETLTDLDRASWAPALRMLDISCEFVRASDLPVSGTGPQLLLNICKHLGADVYLSGAFGKDYLDVAEFTMEGVEVRYHDYTYPIYPQRYGEFVPFLSYLDVLFNAGLDRNDVMAGGAMTPAEDKSVTLPSATVL